MEDLHNSGKVAAASMGVVDMVESGYEEETGPKAGDVRRRAAFEGSGSDRRRSAATTLTMVALNDYRAPCRWKMP